MYVVDRSYFYSGHHQDFYENRIAYKRYHEQDGYKMGGQSRKDMSAPSPMMMQRGLVSVTVFVSFRIVEDSSVVPV